MNPIELRLGEFEELDFDRFPMSEIERRVEENPSNQGAMNRILYEGTKNEIDYFIDLYDERYS